MWSVKRPERGAYLHVPDVEIRDQAVVQWLMEALERNPDLTLADIIRLAAERAITERIAERQTES